MSRVAKLTHHSVAAAWQTQHQQHQPPPLVDFKVRPSPRFFWVRALRITGRSSPGAPTVVTLHLGRNVHGHRRWKDKDKLKKNNFKGKSWLLNNTLITGLKKNYRNKTNLFYDLVSLAGVSFTKDLLHRRRFTLSFRFGRTNFYRLRLYWKVRFKQSCSSNPSLYLTYYKLHINASNYYSEFYCC